MPEIADIDNALLHFYRDLPVIPTFAEATRARRHEDVPPDWWIAIADVAGSTTAIAGGAYKKVNTVGVACIAAVMNVERGIELPYVFGGDGATFAIPDVLREPVSAALRATQRMARERFGLPLRVGLVRVGELLAQGYGVRMGKLRVSPFVTQAVLSGSGWEEAERRVKMPDAQGVLRLHQDEGARHASFDGFECRWQAVPSFSDHKLSLLVAATASDADTNFSTLQRVFEHIHDIYGDVAEYHPLRVDRMRLAFGPRLLLHELRVRAGHLGYLRRTAYLAKMLWLNLAGRYLFARRLDTGAVLWSRYRDDMVDNSDFRKFDGVLRMVIDSSNAQAERLQQRLEAEFGEGRLAYGLHKSREALVTCIVQSYNGNHQHFVDGSDGGYALAARELKQRLTALRRGPVPD